MLHKLIPTNVIGKENDLEYAVASSSQEEARHTFTRACKRLMNPPIWHDLCGTLSTSFMLNGDDGEKVTRLAQLHDYFQIDIPAPGNNTGDGYDWVQLEAIEDNSNPEAEEEDFGLRLRSCRNPHAKSNDIAHFFDQTATSTFIIHRIRNVVTVSYHGRNEQPNTHTAKTSDNIRNAIIAAGAISFLSEAQWSALIRSFLQKEIGA